MTSSLAEIAVFIEIKMLTVEVQSETMCQSIAGNYVSFRNYGEINIPLHQKKSTPSCQHRFRVRGEIFPTAIMPHRFMRDGLTDAVTTSEYERCLPYGHLAYIDLLITKISLLHRSPYYKKHSRAGHLFFPPTAPIHYSYPLLLLFLLFHR
jgi:hypothetical protein